MQTVLLQAQNILQGHLWTKRSTAGEAAPSEANADLHDRLLGLQTSLPATLHICATVALAWGHPGGGSLNYCTVASVLT